MTSLDRSFNLAFFLPEDVQDVPVGMDADQNVGNSDKLEVGLLGVGKEHLGFPDALD